VNDPQDELRSVSIDRQIPHPPEKVWRALTQPHLISEWLMDNDFKAEVNHAFQLRGEWGGVLDCKVITIEPHETLSYTWDFANDDPAFALKSVVTFTLKATDDGTLLRIEQTGFRPEQKQAFGGAKMGWQQFLNNLADLLDRTT